MSRLLITILPCLSVCLVVAPAAQAMDGANISGLSGASASSSSAELEAPTYYESVVASESPAALSSGEPGLPTQLWMSDSPATAQFKQRRDGSWNLELRGLDRPHERIDTVYQVVAVLPLPIAQNFQPEREGIQPREGTEQNSVPLIYGGEKVVLKRNVTLEKALLPGLVGSAHDQLPSLEGTGYDYTLWDTIVRYDESYGETVQVFADVAYTTDGDVSAPDATDERLKAYVLTWVPAMDPSLPIFAIRIDVVDPE